MQLQALAHETVNVCLFVVSLFLHWNTAGTEAKPVISKGKQEFIKKAAISMLTDSKQMKA